MAEKKTPPESQADLSGGRCHQSSPYSPALPESEPCEGGSARGAISQRFGEVLGPREGDGSGRLWLREAASATPSLLRLERVGNERNRVRIQGAATRPEP